MSTEELAKLLALKREEEQLNAERERIREEHNNAVSTHPDPRVREYLVELRCSTDDLLCYFESRINSLDDFTKSGFGGFR